MENNMDKNSMEGVAPFAENLSCHSVSIANVDNDLTARRNALLGNPEEVAQEWLRKLNQNDLSSVNFYDHWRTKVPAVFGLRPNCNCLDIVYDEDKVKVMLFEPLIRFFSGNKDPEEFHQELKTLADSSTLCGRIFKPGEPTYSCRDCGLDPSCVLCFDCFQMSEHRHHRYKIGTSGGSGYCDCGDAEAWKTNVFCQNHKPVDNNEDDNSQQMGEKLPEAMVSRVKLLFDVVMNYCYEVLAPELHCLPRASLQLTEADLNLAEELAWAIPSSNTFCAVVYNDETHSFGQVIQTLMQATKCSRKDAADFATRVDKEGRSIVKCSSLSDCNSIQQTIENQPSWSGEESLKVFIMQSYVVAHQTFAMRLLAWMQEILTHSSGLRYIFCDTVKQSNVHHYATHDRMPFVEGIILSDTLYWKALRTMWHNLIAAGMLQEYEMKKEFAALFAKNYSHLVKDFINDDHEHLFSVTALSVQIFTVPTIAHYLIEEHDIVRRIMRTIIAEYQTVLNADQKLEFEKDSTKDIFQRVDYTFIDLKYILGCPPSVWTENLKQNFLNGLSDALLLLTYVQGMEPVTRQVHSHIEFEIEYDPALFMYAKLARVMPSLSDWVATDKSILIEMYQKCLSKWETAVCGITDQKIVTRELAGYSADCYEYDVSSQPVSLYTPITRFLAALHLHLDAFDLNFFSPELHISNKPCPELIIEPVLRAQVLIAQVRAGMWKRNGYSLLRQVFVYHSNSDVRPEALDNDILTLQMGATLIESNKFILHLLNRFGLFEWAESFYDYSLPPPEEDIVKFKALLAEEFFGLIITLVSARYTPGVGMVSTVDRIRNEVIQQLCIDCMTHSTLEKTLTKDFNNESGLDSVIEQLATFRKVTGGSWTYELKPEFYEEFDLYHYHYSKEDQSKAEEKQRERKKAKGEAEIFPPPKLPHFSPAFKSVLNILKSDVLLHLMAVVIQRCMRKSHTHSDTQLRKILHIIGLGLNEEIYGNDENIFRFTEYAEQWNIFKLLDIVLIDSALSQHHDMIKWIKQRYNRIKPQDLNSFAHMDITVPQSNEDEVQEKKAKAEAAKKRYLEKIQQAQNSFISKNQELFINDEPLTNSKTHLNATEAIEASNSSSIALGPNKSPVFLDEEKLTCILCQEEGRVDTKINPFVLAAFIQRSSVQCKYREKLLEACRNKSSGFLKERDPLFLAPDLLAIPIVSSCGHVMHINCWEKYFEGVIAKETRRPYRLRLPGSFDFEKGEYLCPLCEGICNEVLPLTSASVMNYTPSPTVQESQEYTSLFDVFDNAMQIITHEENISVVMDGNFIPVYMHTREDHRRYLEDEMSLQRLHILQSLSHEDLISKLGDAGTRLKSLFPTVSYQSYYANDDSGPCSSTFLEFLNKFTDTIFKIGLDVQLMEEDYCQSLMLWQAVASTISAMEVFHRDQNLIFFGDEVPQRKTLGLRYLVRGCAVMTRHEHDRDRNNKFIRSHFLKLLIALIQSPSHFPSVLEIDAFTLLVSLTFSISSLFWGKTVQDDCSHVSIPNGNMRDYYLLRMVCMLHAIQVLITADFQDFIKGDSEDSKIEADEVNGSQTNSEVTRKMHIISQVWELVGKSFVCTDVDFVGVWHAVCKAMIPFLRCCAKFYEHLTAIPVPKSLEINEYSFDSLVAYLGLPNTFEELFQSPSSWEMATKWARHPSVIKILTDTYNYNPAQLLETSMALPKMLAVKYPRMANQLFQIPTDYSELMNSASSFTCANFKNNFNHTQTQTICLVCGTMLCSHSYCCQSELGNTLVGSCNYHAYYCGSGSSIFLRIKDCTVIFLGVGNTGCYVSPPYLDAYGETDAGFRRGNPLTLSKEMYDRYRRIWLQNSIQEEISRDPERSVNYRNEWQVL